MPVVKPPSLRPGDWVGIVSPSAPVTAELRPRFERAVHELRLMGWMVKVADHALEAADPLQRDADLRQMLTDPDIRMILMSQGGHSANQLLERFPFDLFRAHPKIFSGISDATTLLNPIFSRTGVVTFHGPDLLWTFGRPLSEAVRQNITDTFRGHPIGRLQPNPAWRHHGDAGRARCGWRCLRGGTATGRLIGGHLSSLLHLMAAGWGPDFAGRILFVEGTEPELGLLHKSLTALRLAGVFERIAGLVTGWFDRLEEDVSDVVLDVVASYSFPILQIDDLGHNVDNYVLPIGCLATLNATDLYLCIDESPVAT